MATTWTITTETDGDVTADYHEPPAPTITLGSEQPHTFGFDGSSVSAYETLRQYLDRAGAATTWTALDGTPYFRELQDDAERSLVVGADPSATVSIRGFWGLVVGGSVETTLPNADLALTLRVFYLAEFGTYADIAAVRTNHEV